MRNIIISENARRVVEDNRWNVWIITSGPEQGSLPDRIPGARSGCTAKTNAFSLFRLRGWQGDEMEIDMQCASCFRWITKRREFSFRTQRIVFFCLIDTRISFSLNVKCNNHHVESVHNNHTHVSLKYVDYLNILGVNLLRK